MKKVTVFACCVAITLVATQCKKDESKPTTPASDPNKDLFAEANATGNYKYYKNSSTILASSPGSGHPNFMRVRFNTIAQGALGVDGKLPSGGTFPEGSVIVKEVFSANDATTVTSWAVMKKTSTGNSANGYVWGEYKTDGAVVYSITNKGANCAGCHAAAGNRDMVRLFEQFP